MLEIVSADNMKPDAIRHLKKREHTMNSRQADDPSLTHRLTDSHCVPPTFPVWCQWLVDGRSIPVNPLPGSTPLANVDHVCNIYLLGQKKDSNKGVRGKVASASARLASQLVRKSDPGVVVLAGERVEIMRWGFHRTFNAAINNARSDKLATGMWAEAFRDRRCVIPVSVFYEWGTGVGGRKQAYGFRSPEDDYLWVAGMWETGWELARATPWSQPPHRR